MSHRPAAPSSSRLHSGDWRPHRSASSRSTRVILLCPGARRHGAIPLHRFRRRSARLKPPRPRCTTVVSQPCPPAGAARRAGPAASAATRRGWQPARLARGQRARGVRVAPPARVALGHHEHVRAERRQQAVAERAPVGRRLGALRGADRPPAGRRGHRDGPRPSSPQDPLQDVAQYLDYLLGLARDGERGAVDLLSA